MSNPFTLGELAKESLATSRSKGFEDTTIENLGSKLLLIVTEVAEAYEIVRDGIDPQKVWYYNDNGKPEGLGPELADIIIRTINVAEGLGIDIEAKVVEKMAYNKRREPKHGRKF